MKRRYLMLGIMVALLATTGCKKEQTGEKVPMTFTVYMEGHGSKDAKVHLDANWKPCWDADDVIQINDGSGTVTPIANNPTRGLFTADITPDVTPYCAVYPAGLVNGEVTSQPTIDLPRVQVYETDVDGVQKINAPMAAYNPQNPVLEFKNLCGLLEITVTNDKAWDMVLDSIRVEASAANLCGKVVYSLSGNNPSLVSFAGDNKMVVSLAGAEVGTNQYASMNERINSNKVHSQAPVTTGGKTSEKYYVTLPPVAQTAGNVFTIRVFSHPIFNKATNSTVTFAEEEEDEVHIVYSRTSSSSAGYILRNEIVPVAMGLSEANILFTSMKAFSVSANTQVCFSRGYTQYNINTHNWRFAPRQWSFLYQSAPNYNSLSNHFSFDNDHPNTTGWIEYFGWATGDDPTRGQTAAAMAPNLTFNNRDLTGNLRNRDWGVNFTNTGATWFTPSQSEYHYVFKDRTSTTMNDGVMGAHTYKFGWATINYSSGNSWGESNNWNGPVYGVILIPDGVNPKRFSQEKGAKRLSLSEFKSNEEAMGDANNNKYRNDNIYTQEQFEYLEAHGCIFFPCIGHIRLEAVLLPIPFYELKNEVDNGGRLNPPDVRIWSRTYDSHHLNQGYEALFDSGNPNSLTQQDTRNVLDASDLACDLHCVRLVCNYGTPYIWDPDQM